jgi:enamine deaminase RidA (YjgF/YER057c/UK114 family)
MCYGVARLPMDARVEIDAVAVVGRVHDVAKL